MRRALLIAAINKKNDAESTGSRCRPINALVIPCTCVRGHADRFHTILVPSSPSLPSAAGISQIDFRPRRSLITRPPLLIRSTVWSRNQIRCRFRRIQRTLSGNHRRFLDRSFRVSRLGVMSIIFFFFLWNITVSERKWSSPSWFDYLFHDGDWRFENRRQILLLMQRKERTNRWKEEGHNPGTKYGKYTQLLFISSTNNYSSFEELSNQPHFQCFVL